MTIDTVRAILYLLPWPNSLTRHGNGKAGAPKDPALSTTYSQVANTLHGLRHLGSFCGRLKATTEPATRTRRPGWREGNPTPRRRSSRARRRRTAGSTNSSPPATTRSRWSALTRPPQQEPGTVHIPHMGYLWQCLVLRAYENPPSRHFGE
jgi:hypothetical protein